MRIYRSNPFNSVGRLPSAPGAFRVAVLALILGGFGIWAERKTSAEGGANVQAALAARGLGTATVKHLGGGCGRTRRQYEWSTATASGTACAGPGDHVEVRPAGR